MKRFCTILASILICFAWISCSNNIEDFGAITLTMPGTFDRAGADGQPDDVISYTIDVEGRRNFSLNAKPNEKVVIDGLLVGKYKVTCSAYLNGWFYAAGSTCVQVVKWWTVPAVIQLEQKTQVPKFIIQPTDSVAVIRKLDTATSVGRLYEAFINLSAKVVVNQDGRLTAQWWECDKNGQIIPGTSPVSESFNPYKSKDSIEIDATCMTTKDKTGDYYFKCVSEFVYGNDITKAESNICHVRVVIDDWEVLKNCVEDQSNDTEKTFFVTGTMETTKSNSTESNVGIDPKGKDITIIAVNGGCTIKKNVTDHDLYGFVFSLTGGGSLTLKGESSNSKLIIDGGGEKQQSCYGLIGMNNAEKKKYKLTLGENCVLQDNVNNYTGSENDGVFGSAVGFLVGNFNWSDDSGIFMDGGVIKNCSSKSQQYKKNIFVYSINYSNAFQPYTEQNNFPGNYSSSN